MEEIEIRAAPGRLIDAVASIGYDHEVALADLMDNCIDAKSTEVKVSIVREALDEEGESDSVSSYVIADNGIGMDSESIKNAFTLGAERDYPSLSLGKFGLGLKSAGLSLANEIVLLTKTVDTVKPLCAILRLERVHSTGKYTIELGEMLPQFEPLWGGKPSGNSGSVNLIRKLKENQPPHATFVEYFRRYCSVAYHMFLQDKSKPFSVSINDVAVAGVDPLFVDEAEANGPMGNPSDWDGRTPRMMLKSAKLALAPGVECEVSVSHLIHPPTFEFDGPGKRAEVLQKYLIESDNYTKRGRHGFYVYRNRRVITTGERFHGVIPNTFQAMAFRGRLMFTENADRIVALDVKKRHCVLPKPARTNLRSMIATHLSTSILAWESAARRAKVATTDHKEEEANASVLNSPVVALSYTPGAEAASEPEVAAKREKQSQIMKETEAAIQDPQLGHEAMQKKVEQKSFVVLTQGLKANAMWATYPAVDYGQAHTMVNKAHSWVALAYAAAEKDARIEVILHQIFTILARAELDVRSTPHKDLPEAAAEKIMERFRKRASVFAEDLSDSLEATLNKVGDGNRDAET